MDYLSYYNHLKNGSKLGRAYKKYFICLIIKCISKFYGKKLLEIGCGVGSGMLGAYPDKVCGIDVNPLAIKFCVENNLNARLIGNDFLFPIDDNSIDVCILDNVLEHISDPSVTFNEIYRVLKDNSGIIVVVPGIKGYHSDDDHKIFYDHHSLALIDSRFKLRFLFSAPFFFKSKFISSILRHYSLIAVYTVVK